MGKHKKLQSHHLYLGIGGMLAIATLVVALTFGLSSAQDAGSMPPPPPPPSGDMAPPPTGIGGPGPVFVPTGDMGGSMPPPTGTYTPPPTGMYTPPTTGTYMPPPTGPYTPPPTGTYMPSPTETPYPYTNSPSACPDGRIPTAAQPCTGTMPSGTMQPSNMPVCAPNQVPSASTPCYTQPTWMTQPGMTQPGMTQPGMTQPGMTQYGTGTMLPGMTTNMTPGAITPSMQQGFIRCRGLGDREVPQAECDAAEGRLPTQMQPQMQPITSTTQDMLQCSFNGTNSYRPRIYYDQTGTKKEMTCADWEQMDRTTQTNMQQDGIFQFRGQMPQAPQMGQQMGPQMGQQGQQGQNMMPRFDCSTDFKNPFCMSGQFNNESFNQVNDMFNNFNTNDVKLGRDLSKEVERLKKEAVLPDKNNTGICNGPGFGFRPRECDLVQAQSQLKETALSAGIGCPAGAQIQTIIEQSQAIFDEIRALSPTAKADEITAATAKFNTLKGDQNGSGILSQLFGTQDPQTGEQVPGLMQGLDSCREVGFVQRDALRELSNFKQLSNTDEYKALQAFAANPLSALPSGVNAFEPWQPDYEACGQWMGMGPPNMGQGGPGMGGPGMGGPGMGGPGMGGPGMGGQNQGGFGGGFGFGFDSVLGLPSQVAQNTSNRGFNVPNNMGGPGMGGPGMGGPGMGGPGMGPPGMGGPGMGPGGPQCGFYEPPAEFMPPEECMPPVQRYLGMPYGKMRELLEALVNKSCSAEGEQQGMMACKGFEQAPIEIQRNGVNLPAKVKDKLNAIIQEGSSACSSNDKEKANSLFKNMMQLVMPFMKGGPPQFVDVNENITDIQDRNNVQGGDELQSLKAEIAALKDQLAAMDQKYQDLLAESTKLASALGQAKDALGSLSVAKEQLARLTSNSATSSIGREMSERNKKMMALGNEVAQELPAEGKQYLAQTLDKVLGGVSSTAADALSEEFDTLSAKVNSGTLSDAEKTAAVKTFKEDAIQVLNSSDEKSRQRSEGVIAFEDTPLNSWVGSWATIAASSNLASTANSNVGVGNKEQYQQAVVRVVRLASAANPELFVVDTENKELVKNIAGVADWAKPFLGACQRAGVEECLNPPVASLAQPIAREQMASLVVNALRTAGIDMPSTENIEVTGVSPQYVEAVKEAKALGVMGGATGPDDVNFGGSQILTVGMDLVIAVKTSDIVNSLESQ